MERTKPHGADALEKRLQDSDIRHVLARLLDRLDTIEEAMDTLQQMPDVLRTATDVVDDELTRAADRDVVLDERAREALTLAEKLTEPETVEVLSGLIDRLDRLEQVAALADDLPDATMVAAETIDDALTRAADRGVVVDERAREGLRLLEQMTEPDTAAALGAVLDRADQLEHLAELADTAPEAIATVVDILDAEYARISARGADPEQVLRQTVGALGRLGDLFRTDEFEALLDSGVLNPEALQAVGSLGTALAESQQEAQRGEIPSRGVFGLLGALRDPDVQRAVGFITTFAKRFGQKLDAST
jgi:uncharacterized protein YjgD (DUF1641 family)